MFSECEPERLRVSVCVFLLHSDMKLSREPVLIEEEAVWEEEGWSQSLVLI